MNDSSRGHSHSDARGSDRPFTAERQMQRRRERREPGSSGFAIENRKADPNAAGVAEALQSYDQSMVIDMLARIETKLDAMGEARESAASAAASLPTSALEQGTLESRLAQLEARNQDLEKRLAQYEGRHYDTKVELHAIKPNNGDEDRIVAAEEELSAIVTATARATDTILSSCEEIERLSEEIAQTGHSSVVSEQIDALQEILTKVYEAANFQDLTGQRITKVVKTLDFVEDRVQALKDMWEMKDGEDLPRPEDVTEDEEAKLLNGPQLEGRGLTQEEIDAMFD